MRHITLYLISSFLIVMTINLSIGQENIKRGGNSFIHNNFCLKEVLFSGSVGNQYIPIRKDDGLEDYIAPHFIKQHPNGCPDPLLGVVTSELPVAYVSGTKAIIQSKIEVNCFNGFWVRGSGPDGITFPSKYVFESPGTVVNYGPFEANNPFPLHIVRHYPLFEIIWEVSDRENGPWSPVDQSVNELYVTFEAPISLNSDPIIASGLGNHPGEPKWGYQWYHSLLNISCSAANGETLLTKIISKIEQKFNSLNLKMKDENKDLFYYSPWTDCNANNSAELLVEGNGQCGSYVRLFLDCLKVMGYDEEDAPMSSAGDLAELTMFNLPGTNIPNPNGFLINTWDFSGSPTQSPSSDLQTYFGYPVQTVTHQRPNWQLGSFINGSHYNWHESQFLYVLGEDCQGPHAYPESIFNNHQVAYINEHFYDPSYGYTFASAQDLKSKISGFYYLNRIPVNEKSFATPEFPMGKDINGNGDIDDGFVMAWAYLVSTQFNLTEVGDTRFDY